MTDLEILLSARQLLLNPIRWRKFGDGTQGRSQWTLSGALLRIREITGCDIKRVRRVLELELDLSGNISLEAFNNASGTTHHLVIELLEKGIRGFGYEGKLLPFEGDEE